MSTFVLTGGAGFIGSCLLRMLNDEGIDDVIVVDNIGSTEKWKNLKNKKYREYVQKELFLDRLCSGEYNGIDMIIHMGACSSTTQTDFDYLWKNNVDYSKIIWKYCTEKQIPLIYASSAATYGDGTRGFSDEPAGISKLQPLNGYGYSKQIFDEWTMKQSDTPCQYVGLKFFNVYGPNEYCKGTMASMAFHGYNQVVDRGKISLFKSENSKYKDGLQERDFVYVKDICKVVNFFIKHPERSGIFNVGTGNAQSFLEFVSSVFYALDMEPEIEFIDMPKHLKLNYQYHTQADISSLRRIGYKDSFLNVKDGVRDYVLNHLHRNYGIY